MSNQATETITKYEVLFAIRTGVTIMMPKTPALDGGDKTPPTFKVSPDSAQDVVIQGAKTALLKNLKKEHVQAAVSRGFLMIYEMDKDDEVVRSTVINLQKN